MRWQSTAILETSIFIATTPSIVIADGGIVDQSHTYPNPGQFGSILSEYAYGQTFTPALSAISFARFYFYPMGVPVPIPVDLAVDLHEFRHVGGPHDEHLYMIIEPSMARSETMTVTEQGVVTFRFPDTVDLIPGLQYALVLRYMSEPANCMIAMGHTDQYPGGQLLSSFWLAGWSWEA
jgi:hypothetical protein